MTKTFAILAAALLSAPAFAQSTSTTVTTAPPPPPPPATSTTVTTQQPTTPAQPNTQVVVNPNETRAAPETTHVRVNDETTVSARGTTRQAGVIVATDAVYGGIAGLAVGGGVSLINQGGNWQRDLMVGAGIGILVGAAYGIYEAVSQPTGVTVTRAEADRDPAANSIPNSYSSSVFARKF